MQITDALGVKRMQGLAEAGYWREGLTLKRIGDTWGITPERVRQIIKEELRRRSRDT